MKRYQKPAVKTDRNLAEAATACRDPQMLAIILDTIQAARFYGLRRHLVIPLVNTPEAIEEARLASLPQQDPVWHRGGRQP